MTTCDMNKTAVDPNIVPNPGTFDTNSSRSAAMSLLGALMGGTGLSALDYIRDRKHGKQHLARNAFLGAALGGVGGFGASSLVNEAMNKPVPTTGLKKLYSAITGVPLAASAAVPGPSGVGSDMVLGAAGGALAPEALRLGKMTSEKALKFNSGKAKAIEGIENLLQGSGSEGKPGIAQDLGSRGKLFDMTDPKASAIASQLKSKIDTVLPNNWFSRYFNLPLKENLQGVASQLAPLREAANQTPGNPDDLLRSYFKRIGADRFGVAEAAMNAKNTPISQSLAGSNLGSMVRRGIGGMVAMPLINRGVGRLTDRWVGFE